MARQKKTIPYEPLARIVECPLIASDQVAGAIVEQSVRTQSHDPASLAPTVQLTHPFIDPSHHLSRAGYPLRRHANRHVLMDEDQVRFLES